MSRTSLMIAALLGGLQLTLAPFPCAAGPCISPASPLFQYTSLLMARAGISPGGVDFATGSADWAVSDRGEAWDDEWDEAWEREQEEGDGESLTSPRRRQGLIEFSYEDDGYASVSILGDFTEWEPEPMDLDSERGVWVIRRDLEPGRYHYHFRGEDAGGSWEAIDPGNPEARKLDDHGWVSVLDIDEDFEERQEQRPGRRYRIERELDRGYEDEEFNVGYQRVDGLSLYFTPDHIARRGFEPSARAMIGYGFKSEEWSLGLTVLQPIAPQNRAWLRLDGYSGTDFTDQTGIGYGENSLAAVFFKSDFRDYYQREGAAASLVASALPWLRAEGGIRSEDYSSRHNEVDWSFAKGDFLPNPPVDEGTLRSAFGRLLLGDADNHLAVEYETSGEDVMGGGFTFEQLNGQYRASLRLGLDQFLSLRVKAGSNLAGELPRQRRYFLGGLGTVRGYPYQSLLKRSSETSLDDEPAPVGGERMLLANAEYEFGFFEEDLQLALLYDAGMAWEDRHAEMALDELKSSAGIGVTLGDDLHFSLMKALDRRGRDPVLELRLERTF